jgi:hypothetical protein
MFGTTDVSMLLLSLEAAGKRQRNFKEEKLSCDATLQLLIHLPYSKMVHLLPGNPASVWLLVVSSAHVQQSGG